MADLLRLGRVLGAGARLVGRHRFASVVAFVLALGWFLAGLGRAHGVEPVAVGRTEPDATRDLFSAVADVGGLVGSAVAFVVAVALVASAGTIGLALWMHRTESLRGRAIRPVPRPAAPHGWTGRPVPRGADGALLGAVTRRQVKR